MPWTEVTHRNYDRRYLHYASDCKGIERSLIASFLLPASNVSRPRTNSMRHIWNAISYISATGCYFFAAITIAAIVIIWLN